jgi:polyphenol oxidase
MLVYDPLQSPLLAALPAIEHGFGTRFSDLSQDAMSSLQQIHSARCVRVSAIGRAGEGDALITSQTGLAVSIRTADCLPILVADPVSGAVGAIHAGWRGTVSGIVRETMIRMGEEFGSRPEDLRAAIGPGIGVCCYHVGAEVARHFGRSDAGCVDLAHDNRRQLLEAGVPEAQIEVLGVCTFCDPRFHSWRRDKERAGRMISFIRLVR